MKCYFEKWTVSGAEYVFLTVSQSSVKSGIVKFKSTDYFTEVEKKELSEIFDNGCITQTQHYEIYSVAYLWDQMTVMLRERKSKDDRR